MKEQLKILLKSAGFLLLLFYFPSLMVSFLPFNYQELTNSEQIIINLVINIIFLVLIISAYFKTLKKDFKLFFKDFFNNFETAFKYWFVGFLIMVISNLIITIITNGGIASNEEEIRSLVDVNPLYMIFSITIFAPFTEELIFRKGFKDIFKKKWIFIIVSGITFGSLHVVGTITEISDLLFLIPYCSLGITFAYLYYKTNNIFSTITMHMMHNTLALVLYFIGNLL